LPSDNITHSYSKVASPGVDNYLYALLSLSTIVKATKKCYNSTCIKILRNNVYSEKIAYSLCCICEIIHFECSRAPIHVTTLDNAPSIISSKKSTFPWISLSLAINILSQLHVLIAYHYQTYVWRLKLFPGLWRHALRLPKFLHPPNCSYSSSGRSARLWASTRRVRFPALSTSYFHLLFKL
jgi:hypothetical protein